MCALFILILPALPDSPRSPGDTPEHVLPLNLHLPTTAGFCIPYYYHCLLPSTLGMLACPSLMPVL